MESASGNIHANSTVLLVSMKQAPALRSHFHEDVEGEHPVPENVAVEFKKHRIFEDRNSVRLTDEGLEDLKSIPGLELTEETFDIVPIRMKVFENMKGFSSSEDLDRAMDSHFFPRVIVNFNVVYSINNAIKHFSQMDMVYLELAVRGILGIIALAFVYWIVLQRWVNIWMQIITAN